MTELTINGAIERAIECVSRNAIPGEPTDLRDVCTWAVGAAFRYIRGEPEPGERKIEIIPPRRHDGGGHIHETGPTALGGPQKVLKEQASAMGYTGHSCPECGNFTMVQNGTCLKCMTCGSTTGCS